MANDGMLISSYLSIILPWAGDQTRGSYYYSLRTPTPDWPRENILKKGFGTNQRAPESKSYISPLPSGSPLHSFLQPTLAIAIAPGPWR
jgi:hypothetical protein